MLRDVITHIGGNIAQARKSVFGNHPLANYIRVDAAAALRGALGDENSGFRVKGSPGQGRWANSVWLGIFNQSVTHNAAVGYYVVYAFSFDGDMVYLALIQGNSSLYHGLGVKAEEILAQRSAIARERIGEFNEYFSDLFVSLGQVGEQVEIHKAGYILGKVYAISSLPLEEELLVDLKTMVKAYNTLVFRGGVSAVESVDDGFLLREQTVDELLRFRLHRVVERAHGVSRKVKRVLGTKCQACGMTFAERYGTVGEGYIEAHHRTPVSRLPVEQTVSLNIEKDFSVLCANCHRMVHRLEDTGDIEGLRRLILAAKG